jgi:hypothetical protein
MAMKKPPSLRHRREAMAKKAGKQKTTKKATTTNQKQKAKSRLARARGRGAKDAHDRFPNMSGSDAR